jgi:hypothetical protein
MASLAALGTTVDTIAYGLASDDRAARQRRRAAGEGPIERLPAEAAALVIRYGRTGLRPEFGAEGEGSWEQDVDAAGRLRWDWDDPVNRSGGSGRSSHGVRRHRS